jgi:exodeoxyribonuclease VII small subunit
MKKEVSFEEGIARLQEIVSLLENGDASLDESLKLFEEGVKISDICSNKLKKAEQAVINITEKKDKNESPVCTDEL